MIKPEDVAKQAKKKENENYRFRKFLKMHADEETLDQQFLAYHNELFTEYDCNQCRNCCKEFHGEIKEFQLESCANHLKITKEQFVDFFLADKEEGFTYQTKHKPCDFLRTDGSCMLGDCKPENCKTYPFTNKPGRLWALYSVLDTVSVCPVAFEIYERLKKDYGFKAK